MKSSMYTTSYLIWGAFAMMIGISFIGVLVEGGKNIATNHIQPVSAEEMSLEHNIVSAVGGLSLTQEENPSPAPATREQLPFSEEFSASVIQARILHTLTQYKEVQLLDSEDFDTGICEQSDTIEFPRYFAPMSRGFTIEDYVPSFLVEIQKETPTKERRTICMDETAAIYLKALFDAAHDDGYDLMVSSGYRSHTTQQYLYKQNKAEYGDLDYRHVAEPGYSEHQLGTTIDITTSAIANASAAQSFGDSDAFRWMEKHADEYGFVLSYPKGKEDETGYIYEPWHWRFVGTDNVDLFDRENSGDDN